MSVAPERTMTIAGGELRLEAAIRDGDGSLAAVVMHPHPLYGGDMDNHVVTAICDLLATRGATSLRFNFRGTGRSQGSHDGGAGEVDDARAAISAVRAAASGARLVVVGYSFGAVIAAAVAQTSPPDALILVSPPSSAATIRALDPQLETLLITGGSDTIAPGASVLALASGGIQAVVVDGVDHAWWPGVDQLCTHIDRFVDALSA